MGFVVYLENRNSYGDVKWLNREISKKESRWLEKIWKFFPTMTRVATANFRLFYLQINHAFSFVLRLVRVFLIRMSPCRGLYDNFFTKKLFFEVFSSHRVETINLRSFFSNFWKFGRKMAKHGRRGNFVRRIQIINFQSNLDIALGCKAHLMSLVCFPVLMINRGYLRSRDL